MRLRPGVPLGVIGGLWQIAGSNRLAACIGMRSVTDGSIAGTHRLTIASTTAAATASTATATARAVTAFTAFATLGAALAAPGRPVTTVTAFARLTAATIFGSSILVIGKLFKFTGRLAGRPLVVVGVLRLRGACAWLATFFAALIPASTAPAAAFAAAWWFAVGRLVRTASFDCNVFGLAGIHFLDLSVNCTWRLVLAVETPVHVDGSLIGAARGDQRQVRFLDREVRALHLVARLHRDRNTVAVLHVDDERALVVQDVQRDASRSRCDQRGASVGNQGVFERADDGERHRLGRADDAGALAMRALRGGAFEHAGAQPLARHFEQSEMADAADLDARTIEAQRVLDAAFDGAIVALFLHVDEIDDDQAGEIAQLELTGNFVGSFEVGVERRFLDRKLAGRFARVDVDRDQRFRLVDDEVAAGTQIDERTEHRVQLLLDLVFVEQRLRITIVDHVLGVARHQHAHEVARFAVRRTAGDHDLVDLLGVQIADRALDQIAFLVDEAWCGRLQRHVAHIFPQAEQVFEIALDLLRGAGRTRGADDQTHAFRHVELLGDGLEALAVLGVGDLAADAAAARGIRHQHGVAAGQRQVGGEGSTLGAALFLDDLHQNDLAALDNFLDLVGARAPARADRHFPGGVFGSGDVDGFGRGGGAIAVHFVGVIIVRAGVYPSIGR